MNLINNSNESLIDMDYYYPFNQSHQYNLNTFVRYRHSFQKHQFQELKQKVRQHFSINNATIIRIFKVQEDNNYNSLCIYFQYVPYSFRNFIKSMTRQQIAIIKNRLMDVCSELISYHIYPEISECNIGFDSSRNIKLYLPIDFNRLSSLNRNQLLKIKQTEINRILNQCLIQQTFSHNITTPITNRGLLNQSKSQQNSRMIINFNYRSPPITNRVKNYSTFSLQKFNKNQPKIQNSPKYQESHNKAYVMRSPINNYVPQRKLYNNYNKSTSNLISNLNNQKPIYHNVSYEHPNPNYQSIKPIPATTRYFINNSNINNYNNNNYNKEFNPINNQFYKVNGLSSTNQKFNFMKSKEVIISPKQNQNQILTSHQKISSFVNNSNNREIILSPTDNQYINVEYPKNNVHTTYYFLPDYQQHQQPYGSSSYDQVNPKFNQYSNFLIPKNEQTINEINYYQESPQIKTFDSTEKIIERQSIQKNLNKNKKNEKGQIEFHESFIQKNIQQNIEIKKPEIKQITKKKVINKTNNNKPINSNKKITNNNNNTNQLTQNNNNNNKNIKNKLKQNTVQYENPKVNIKNTNVGNKQISPNKNTKNNVTPTKPLNQTKYNQQQKINNSKLKNNKKYSPVQQEKVQAQVTNNNKNKNNFKVDYNAQKFNKPQQLLIPDDNRSFDTYHQQLGEQIAMPKMNVQEMRQTTNSPRNGQRRSPQKLHESVGIDNWKYIQERSQDIQEKTELSRQQSSYRKKQISQKQKKSKTIIPTFKRSNTMPEQNQGNSNQIQKKNGNNNNKYHQPENQITQTQKEESQMKESNDPLTKEFNILFSNQYEPAEHEQNQQKQQEQQHHQNNYYQYHQDQQEYEDNQNHQKFKANDEVQETHIKSPRSNQINQRVRIALQKSEATLEFFNKFKKNINQNFSST